MIKKRYVIAVFCLFLMAFSPAMGQITETGQTVVTEEEGTLLTANDPMQEDSLLCDSLATDSLAWPKNVCARIDRLLETLDPAGTCFVIGHSLTGVEGYLVQRNNGRFRIAAIVPNRISRAERKRLLEAGVSVRISIESSGMGLYKSFAYEIFKRMNSVLLAFDGNAPALNLIQEAKNGRCKCRIFVNPRSRGLTVKAKLLEGYVQPLTDAETIAEAVRNLH